MPDIKLTPRLQCIAEHVPVGSALADVGTDHAYLPLYLLQEKIVSYAIGSDLRTGPLSRARENAQTAGLYDQLTLRLAAGLDAVAPHECNVISIAGMGGETIAEILTAAPWTAQGAHTLLLQPMTRIAELRRFLRVHGYRICAEYVCREERRFYVVLQVQGGGTPEMPAPALWDCYVSRALLQAAQAQPYLTALLRRERHALAGMERGKSEEAELTAQRNIVRVLQSALEELT